MTAEPSRENALKVIDASIVRAGQRWRHYKSGNVYQVIAIGIMEASLDPAVVYAGRDGVVWVRSLSIFTGHAASGNALIPRFSLVED